MRALALSLVLCVVLGACQKAPDVPVGTPPPPPKDYVANPDGLRAIWSDVLTAARADERQKVHDLIASQMMTDDDLVALFGPARAKEMAPRYAPMISKLVNQGSMELIAQIYERKYDEVEVFPEDASGTPTDRATLAVLPPGTQVFGVRVKRKGEKLGLRYDFFVFRAGRWVTGNQLGKYFLAPLAQDGGAR